MEQYGYKFVWIENGVQIEKYIYANSLEVAKKKLKDELGVDPTKQKISYKRLEGPEA